MRGYHSGGAVGLSSMRKTVARILTCTKPSRTLTCTKASRILP
nr:MAG TPA: hypothetical protein [Caudoviricetes sp.]